ncbi:hypothetical protein [Pseudonocardia sp.]|uniref:hypothetical protein n=1 Tax=Pseudonocardia sp. TaxID=60912 RepID=UPI0031FE3C63
MRRAHFINLTKRVETVKKLGRPASAATSCGTREPLAAQTGASTKDLMSRMGHDNMRALIDQHATSQADRLIADRQSGLLDEHRRTRRKSPEGEEDGPAGHLVPVS